VIANFQARGCPPNTFLPKVELGFSESVLTMTPEW